MKEKKKEYIYMDHAATTEILPEVQSAMEPYLTLEYGNASTSYKIGRTAYCAIEKARETIATLLGASAEEIYFTSGGSESDNWALKSIARKQAFGKIVTTPIEHHAILNTCNYLEELGQRIEYLEVDQYGFVNMEHLKECMEQKPLLLSVMYANNEIGTIQPIAQIGALAKKHGVIFHTDAVQAIGQIPIALNTLPVDLLSASSHKFHGPKGVGFLYVKNSMQMPSYIHGGSQERGKRAGTENVAGIVGMAKALELAVFHIEREQKRLRQLRDYFISRVLKEIKEVRYNGHPYHRLPGNMNIGIKGIDATSLLILLEEDGIYASAGSACTTGESSTSHVIRAINVEKEYQNGCIRFSLGKQNEKSDIDVAINSLKRNVRILRGE